MSYDKSVHSASGSNSGSGSGSNSGSGSGSSSDSAAAAARLQRKLQVSHCEKAPDVDCAHKFYLDTSQPNHKFYACEEVAGVCQSVKEADSTIDPLTDSCCPALFPLCSGAEDDMGTITNAPKNGFELHA